MQEKMIEIEELKKELVNAQMAASKVRKLDDNFLQAPEVQRRVRSLDGCEADSSLKQLRAQVYHNMWSWQQGDECVETLPEWPIQIICWL